MTERDYRILLKIVMNQTELSAYAKEFRISSASDMNRLHPATRRGIIGFIGDLFELTKPLSDHVKSQLPLNQSVIKQFRNTSIHQYGVVTDVMAYACLMHCIDKVLVRVVKDLVDEYKTQKSDVEISKFVKEKMCKNGKS